MESKALEILEERLHAAAELPTHTPTRLVPKGMELVSLEEYQEHRSEYRGLFCTQSIEDFATYAAAFPGAKCFVDQESMTAENFFDLGDDAHPGHGRHRAHLALSKTAAFKSLLSVSGCQHSQKGLAEWLEDWRDFITPIGTDDIKKAIAAVRNITISAKADATFIDEDFRGSRSVAEEIEAKSQETLPTGFTFECEPYHGLLPRTFSLRLSVLTGEASPKLVLRITRWEEYQEAMALEFTDLLTHHLGEEGADTTIYLGKFTP